MTAGGFVDIQVNGWRGVDFSSPSLAVEDVLRVADHLAECGTAAYLPTVTTSPPEVYEKALPVIAEAKEKSGGRILGVHLEGPFISREDGAVGAHPKACVQAPSPEALDVLLDYAPGLVKLITIAPEMPGALDLIRRAVKAGVTVSIGHSLAKAGDVKAAADAGATLVTHFGNGCPNMVPRHDNFFWPVLAEERLKCLMISDGHHTPPALLKTVLLAKGVAGMTATSDMSAAAGLPVGEYTTLGTRVRVEASGRISNLNAPTLAGSSADMLTCLNHLAELKLAGEADLWRLGRDNPLAAIGLTAAALPKAGYRPHRFDGIRFVPA